MALVPIQYNLRSLIVRRGSTMLTVISIGATIGVLSAVLSLQTGFENVFTERGREDLAVVLRTGAGSEGESSLQRKDIDLLTKGSEEFAVDENGDPIASAESYLAIRRRKFDGGETNVAIRGVQQGTFAVHGDELRLLDGRRFEPGTDEVIIGKRLLGRFPDAQIGETMNLNLTPFRVVGVFEGPGAFETEIWGDVDRVLAALDRTVFNRVIGKLKDGVSAEQFNERLEADKRISAKAVDEVTYLKGQTVALTGLFKFLGGFLFFVMGLAAIFTGLNSIYASISARRREVGILLATGYRPFSVFLSFWLESAMIGLLGGLFGILLVLPLNGLETGTTNFQTFTEVAFEFQVDSTVLMVALISAVVLGLVGGALPAWKAARMEVTDALRRA
ncbi:MAG: ABC transporter permease [Planctomycetota bacterium]